MHRFPKPYRRRRPSRRSLLAALLTGAAALAFPSLAAAEIVRFGGTGSAVAGIQLLAEAFRKGRPDVQFILITGLGSSGGIKGVRSNAIDLAVTGRPLKNEEKDPELVSVPYARTPFVFVAGRGTTGTGTTTAEVVSIYTGQMVTWPGGTPVRLVLRPENESETSLLRQISPQVRGAVDAAMRRPGMTYAATGQDNGDYLEQLPGSFGATTLAQMITERRAVDVLALNDVMPSVQTLTDGSYPHAATFYFVKKAHASPTVDAFISFVLSKDGAAILRASGCLPTASVAR